MSTIEKQPAHSPLGASSAERWMECPGSTALIKSLDMPKSDEEEWTKLGTQAHDVAAFCLRKGIDTWEIMGPFHGEKGDFTVDLDMAEAVQLYLDTVRALRAARGPEVKSWVEYRISDPDIHKDFYGTVDDAEIFVSALAGQSRIDVNDYKHGQGIAVSAFRNVQLMYYAIGVIGKFVFTNDDVVTLRIVQPRAYHDEGPVRTWETTVGELRKWRDETLVPAMHRAEIDGTLTPGEHCRFCPAKLVCPLLTALFGASVSADASAIANFSNATLGRNAALVPAVEHYIRALEKEVFNRMNRGEEVSAGTPETTFKLVPKKANRVWNPEGVALLEGKAVDPETKEPIPAPFDPKEVFETSIKSPAQFEGLGSKAKAFVKEWAFTPQTALTVAVSTDRRAGVKITPPTESFAHIQPEG